MTIVEGTLYGESLYGDAYYGNPLGGTTSLPTYSAAPMVAEAIGYAAIQITWAIPNSGYQLRLVRNSFSVPADQKDGINLTQVAYTAPPFYLDTTLGANSGGLWLYYSLFMLTSAGGGFWQRAADAMVMLPNNWGYGERMFSLLPAFYRSMDDALDTTVVAPPAGGPSNWSDLNGATWATIN
jgi:hypothetical protein